MFPAKYKSSGIRRGEYLAILPLPWIPELSEVSRMVRSAFSALGRYEYGRRRDESIKVIYDPEPAECPHCHSKRFIRYGHVGSNRRERYLCKDCRRTFVSSEGTVYYRGRLGQHDVRNLLDLLNAGTTIKGAAGRAHINKNTSLRYRHMLLRFMKNASRKPVLSGKVEIDETYRGRSGRTGKGTKKKGISRQKEGMAIGTDSSGKVALCDLKAGHPTLKSLRRAWKGRIKEGSTVVHDSLHGYKGLFSPSDGRTEVWVKSKVPEQETMLSDLNKACSGLKWFLRKHRGIKKRYLKYYLAWYEFVQNFSPTNTEFEELVFGKYLQKQLTTLN